ncbi:MAG: KEOPS complex subunit Cgi121 [Promethearchaeota archaeon]
MIKRSFFVEELELKYFVGIAQIKFDLNQLLIDNKIRNEEDVLKWLFLTIEDLQIKHPESTIQFISDKYVLNQDHLYVASYFMEKAFLNKNNISNKKNIELLLYLSTNRQISKAIESFGISKNTIKEEKLTICIISQNNNLDIIIKEILDPLKANEVKITVNDQTIDKINRIISKFEISETQIKSVHNSFKESDELDKKININILSLVIFDLICEKMAILNLE